MILKEFLDCYKAEPGDIGGIVSKTIQFTNFMKLLASYSPGVDYLNKLCAVYKFRDPNNYTFNASEYEEFLCVIGIDPENITVDKFISLANTLSLVDQTNFSKLAGRLVEEQSGFDFSLFREVPYKELSSYFSSAEDFKDVKVNLADHNYLVPPNKDSLLDLIRAFPQTRLRYIPDRRDCEDFSLMFKAWLAEIGYGNVACGMVWAKIYKPGATIPFHHALAFGIYYENSSLAHLYFDPEYESLTIWSNAVDNSQGLIIKKYERMEPYFVYI